MVKKLITKYQKLPVQVRASFWFLICAFLQRGISVITTPIFTRLLSTAEYGQYNVFNSWLNILTVFVTLKLSSGVYTRGLVKFEREANVFASSLQGLTLMLVIIWTVIYLLMKDFWNEVFSLTTVQVLAMLLMMWTTEVFHFWAAEQRVHYHYRVLVFVSIVISILKPVTGVIFVILAEDKVTARILSLALVELFGYVSFFIIQMLRGKIFYHKVFWKHALLFNLTLVPHYLSTSVLSGADRIMINDMVGADAAGIYSLAYSISLIMTLFNTALLNTIEPWMYRKIKDGRTTDIVSVAYPAFILIAGLNLLLIAFAPEALAIFAPPTYYEAIWVIPPVAMSVYFMFTYSFFAVFEFYHEKTIYVMVSTLAGAVLNIVLNAIFIRWFGYYAAGYTTLACYMIYSACHYYFMVKVCKKYMNGVRVYKLKTIMLITGIFMAAGFIFMLTYRAMVVRYGVIILIGILAVIKRKKLMEMAKMFADIRKKR